MYEDLNIKYRNLFNQLQIIKKEIDNLEIEEIELKSIIKDNFNINNGLYQEETINEQEKKIIDLKKDLTEVLIPQIKNKI